MVFRERSEFRFEVRLAIGGVYVFYIEIGDIFKWKVLRCVMFDYEISMNIKLCILLKNVVFI